MKYQVKFDHSQFMELGDLVGKTNADKWRDHDPNTIMLVCVHYVDRGECWIEIIYHQNPPFLLPKFEAVFSALDKFIVKELA